MVGFASVLVLALVCVIDCGAALKYDEIDIVVVFRRILQLLAGCSPIVVSLWSCEIPFQILNT
jgi:hypothetical protein